MIKLLWESKAYFPPLFMVQHNVEWKLINGYKRVCLIIVIEWTRVCASIKCRWYKIHPALSVVDVKALYAAHTLTLFAIVIAKIHKNNWGSGWKQILKIYVIYKPRIMFLCELCWMSIKTLWLSLHFFCFWIRDSTQNSWFLDQVCRVKLYHKVKNSSMLFATVIRSIVSFNITIS